jgi:L-Ala-D/L-Glu epimerase
MTQPAPLRQVEFRQSQWEFITPFRIAYRTRTHSETVVVELQEGAATGRGEASGVSYHGESIASVLAQLEAVADALRNGLERSQLQDMLPPGGARNAIDCALWDLEAKRSGSRAWDLAGVAAARPLLTSYTLGIDTAEAMSRAAAAAIDYPVLKLKLAGTDDLQRVSLVRQMRPDAELIVDANQAWSEQQLRDLAPRFADLGVTLIEQPLVVGKDAMLGEFNSPVPLCADESCQTCDSLPSIVGKYQYVNIKLDKTGGLTEALRLARAAREQGLKLMVGCMGGSSLSMAPAFLIGQLCEFVDLDSPLLTKHDVQDPIRYQGARMSVPEARLWG